MTIGNFVHYPRRADGNVPDRNSTDVGILTQARSERLKLWSGKFGKFINILEREYRFPISTLETRKKFFNCRVCWRKV
jgi:hypothetical protein